MNWFQKLSKWFRSLWQRREVKQEIDEELRFHLEQRTAENLAAGMAPEEAAREARKRFGNLQSVREECREKRNASFGETTLQDVRFGARMLRKNPGFTTIAVLSLALGIGANTAIFSLLNAVLLRSMPVHNPQELRSLNWVGSDLKVDRASQQSHKTQTGLTVNNTFSYPTYLEFRDQARCFSDLSAFFRLGQLSVVSGDQAFSTAGLMVSGNFFKTLGLEAIAGRTLLPEDDHPAAAPATVISYACWQSKFSGDPDVLGKAVAVNQHSFTIVGVLPEKFHGVHAGMAPEFYVPMSAQPQVNSFFQLESKDHWWVELLGRLQPGVDERKAQAALNVLFNQSVGAASGNEMLKQAGIVLEDGSRGPLGQRLYYAGSLKLLLGVVALVLLVACANLAGLLLARAAARQHEMAIRAAVGAGRWRLLRQSMTESLLIAFGGAGLGFLFATWGKGILSRLLWPSTEPVSFDLTSDGLVFIFTLAITFVTALLFGLAPAWRASRVDPASGLKDRASMGVPRLRLGKGLIAVQVGLSVFLVFGAGLLIRTLINLRRIDPGYNTENLLVFRLTPAGYQDQRLLNFYRDVSTGINAIPGVRSVAFSDALLLSGWMNTGGGLTIPGRTKNPDEKLSAIWAHVSHSFFSTMGIPLQLGREFTIADNETSPKVIVVNQALARSFFPGDNPIGRVIRLGDQSTVEIVGVCRDLKFDSLKSAAAPAIFFPDRQDSMWVESMYVEVRSALPPLSLVPAVRKAVAAIDRNIPVADITTQKLILDRSIAQEKLFASLCGALALLAMLLSCIGLYGLMAYNVARRTGEIGIRMALGATRRHIVGPILREALVLAAFGVAVGVPAAFALTRFIKSQLFGVQPTDPATLIGAGVLLIAVAVLAAWIPARRAAKVDPMEALRCE
jgi:predicted permease